MGIILSVAIVLFVFLVLSNVGIKESIEENKYWHDKERTKKKIRKYKIGKHITVVLFLMALFWMLYWNEKEGFAIDWEALALPIIIYALFHSKEKLLRQQLK